MRNAVDNQDLCVHILRVMFLVFISDPKLNYMKVIGFLVIQHKLFWSSSLCVCRWRFQHFANETLEWQAENTSAASYAN